MSSASLNALKKHASKYDNDEDAVYDDIHLKYVLCYCANIVK